MLKYMLKLGIEWISCSLDTIRLILSLDSICVILSRAFFKWYSVVFSQSYAYSNERTHIILALRICINAYLYTQMENKQCYAYWSRKANICITINSIFKLLSIAFVSVKLLSKINDIICLSELLSLMLGFYDNEHY